MSKPRRRADAALQRVLDGSGRAIGERGALRAPLFFGLVEPSRCARIVRVLPNALFCLEATLSDGTERSKPERSVPEPSERLLRPEDFVDRALRVRAPALRDVDAQVADVTGQHRPLEAAE